MRILNLLLASFVLLTSCNNSDKKETKKETKKEESIKKFGFDFADYKVLQNKVKSGDTFGGLIESYFWPDSLNVYQVTQKVKDSFNLRNIKIGKEYYIFLNKEKTFKIIIIIYNNYNKKNFKIY